MRLRFAVVGDNGTGGRNAMRVATQMARAYPETPFGLLVHTGDLPTPPGCASNRAELSSCSAFDYPRGVDD